jgi:hypothetical protein
MNFRMTEMECSFFEKEKINSNPRYKNFHQALFTAGDVDQFNSFRTREDLFPRNVPLDGNLFETEKPLKVWSKFQNLDSKAVENTFNYIFHKLKKGIFVRIANNALETFLPFSNAHYKNEFGHLLRVNPKYGSVKDFLRSVSAALGYRFKNDTVIKPFDEWVANNALVRYDENEGDNNVAILYDMFKTLCDERLVPDVEFFVNRRDFPQLKVDGTEPYNHIFGSKHYPLVSHSYDKYAPILSGSSAKDYADIPFPTYEDWARAVNQETGKVFPNACRTYPKISQIPWKNKSSKAVFRGATTGAGVTPATNQRLNAFEISLEHENLLDVGFTKWNLRPRKLEDSEYLQTIERSDYPVANRLNLQEQSKFKYILNLEGHVAAYRLSYELSSGSVVLLADSKWKMWYSDILKPYVHYVPVKGDLSDLLDVIEWCKTNDSKCKEIATNAREFYDKYLGTAGILDFLQKELKELSSQTGPYRYFPDLIFWSVNDEKIQLDKQINFSETTYRYQVPQSPRCVGVLDAMLQVVRSKSLSEMNWEKNVFQNVNGRIDKYVVNGFPVVGKKASRNEKIIEHVHESYIGLNAVNRLVGKIPNFSYVFGPLKDAPDMVFSEFIRGVPMMNWLKSSDYSFPSLLAILVQTNLALSVAQNFAGFIHYDLYPWNVMIQKIPSDENYHGKDFDYYLPGKQNAVTIVNPDRIPVIVDYGKSRAIVYEPEYGTIDHGFSNLYEQNSIVDTLTLLYGSLCVLKDAGKLGPKEMQLVQFPQKLGLKNAEDLKRWCKYGALFDFRPRVKGNAPAIPKHFVDFVMTTFPEKPVLKQTLKYSYQMEKGFNPVVATSFMENGNVDEALQDFVKHVDRSRPPQSDDGFFQHVISSVLQRRLAWVEEEIETKASRKVKAQWNVVRKMFSKRPKIFTEFPEMDYPKPPAVWLGHEMSPEYVQKLRVYDISPDEDWLTTWTMCVESVLFGVVKKFGEFGNFVDTDGFLYQNAVASNNTLAKIKKSFDL